MSGPLLQARGLESFYGSSQVLFGLDFEIGQRQVVTLLGRNGMGKSTLVKSLMGLVQPRGGTVHMGGTDITGAEPHEAARSGIALVPEGRRIFPNLTVRENLVATARVRRQPSQTGAPPWDLARVFGMFPRLKERQSNLGWQLSGGEQQMLAIGRALMTNPRLLVLDEATEGLAPIVRADIWRCLDGLKQEGLSMLVIDKNIPALLALADHHVVIEKGRVVWQGPGGALRRDPDVLERYVGV